jgi:two-component system, chemotaxis family, sensor kinase Cph1
VAPDAVIGRPLAAALGESEANAVRAMTREGGERAFGIVRVRAGDASSIPFDATLHRSGGLLLLELEPGGDPDALTTELFRDAMRSTVSRLERADSVFELAQGVAAEMRAVTGFDRIWVYRFHEDWHGEIIGESKREGIETWMGMHYPASDIPAQARALFLKNWIRAIPDIGFTPSTLVPRLNPLNGEPLDLGGSGLRSVSPIHVRYLQNMGVTASLVISLIHRGKLWGLVSGHHYEGPKRVTYAMRTLCEFLAQALSLQIGSTDRIEDRAYELTRRELQGRMLVQLSVGESVETALAARDVTLQEVIGASGAALVLEGRITLLGATPTRPQIEELLRWLRRKPDDLFQTAALSAHYPEAAAFQESGSGLLAAALSNDRRDYLLWFRGEQKQAVKWAGDPRKPVTLAGDGSARLQPRGSFELWEEEARGTAQPWKSVEVDAARDVRRAVLDLLIRRAEETARVNADLVAANALLEENATELALQAEELLLQRSERDLLLDRERASRGEAERANRAKADFLAVMSHELRTPLNAIGGYAQLLSLGIRGDTTAEQRADLARIQVNQRHLLGLINSILNFTKLEAGGIQFARERVPVDAVLDDLQAMVGPQLEAKLLRFSVDPCDTGVAVRADPEKLRQVLLNLLTNAIKFTAAGGAVRISCSASLGVVSISVTDTGRGIAVADLEAVFDPFVQVDRHVVPEQEQGVGLGLAISRELARGMHGELHAESVVGEGSTFTLTLPAYTD